MNQLGWRLLVVCCIFVMVDGGVKIEITHVKNKPKVTNNPQDLQEEKTTLSDKDATEATTISTTSLTPTMQSVITTITTEASVIKLANSTLSSTNVTSEVTTVKPLNATEAVKSPINNTNTNANVNITSINNVTQSFARDLNPYLSEFTRRQMRRKLIPTEYYCPCDLKINFCDINCCCDVDCATKEIIQTLKCNERDWSIHDYEESSELQLCSQAHQFSLFCIVDNTRKRKQSRKRDYKVHNVNIMSVVRYKWPNQYDEKTQEHDYREHYTFGDSILAWDESSDEIQSLDVPWSFGASNCRIKNAVKHLVDDEMRCVQTIEEHDQFIADLQIKLKTMKILKYRKPLDTQSVIMTEFCKTAQMFNETENCTEAAIYHCVETISMRTCTQDANSSSIPEFGENFISDELSIQIHHNFTNILNVTVFFVYHEFSDTPTTHVIQKITIEYLEMNETFAARDAHQVSGNIGYLLHKPIIVTKFIRQNETTDENSVRLNGVLSYFHNETNCTNDGHYLKMPAIESNGDCVINNYTFQTVNFGERSRIKCDAALVVSDSNETDSIQHPSLNEQNNTYICRAFQKQILEYLLYGFELENLNATTYDRFNARLSELGNPRNDTDYWHDFKIVKPLNMEEIVAINVANDGTEFTCTNMVLGVRFEFFYGTMYVGQVSNQAVIKVAQIQFGNRIDLKFKVDDNMLKVPLYIDVMFYDFSHIVGNTSTSSLPHIAMIFIIITVQQICCYF